MYAIHTIFAKVELKLRNCYLGIGLTLSFAQEQHTQNDYNEFNMEKRKNTTETRIASSFGDADESTAKREHVDFHSDDSAL